MSRMLGAPLGGTTCGGQYGVESLASSLITPPNCAGGAGSCLPSMVVVALGEPGTPVTCCAVADIDAMAANPKQAMNHRKVIFILDFPLVSWAWSKKLPAYGENRKQRFDLLSFT